MSGNIPDENRRGSGKSNQSDPTTGKPTTGSQGKKDSLGSSGSGGIPKNVKEKEDEERRNSENSAKSKTTSFDSGAKSLSVASASGQSNQEVKVNSQVSVEPIKSDTKTAEERRRSSNKSDKSNKVSKPNKVKARQELMAASIQKIGQRKVEEKRTSGPVEPEPPARLGIIKIPDFKKPEQKSPSEILPERQASRQQLQFSSDPPEEFIVERDTSRYIDGDDDDEYDDDGRSYRDRAYSVGSDYYSDYAFNTEDDDTADDADLLLSLDATDSGVWKLPNLHLDACLPEIRQFSSGPDIMFYMANVVNCICGLYMFATGTAAYGWEYSVKSILIQDDQKQSTSDFDLGALSVTGRGHVAAFMAVLGWVMSVIGSIGFYYAKWPLIKLNLWTYGFITVIQLFMSLWVAITAPQACAGYTGMREPMLRHLQKFYTDSDGVKPGQIYQDHHDRINDMQSAVSCCGLKNYNDFRGLPGSPAGPFKPPRSCCEGPWKLNIFCTVGNENEYKKRMSNVGCETRVRSLCYNVMAFFGYGGFIIALLLIGAFVCSSICTLYMIRMEKAMQASEIVYVERLNLFMPEIIESEESAEEQPDEMAEKRLLADTDKIKLSDKVSGFVDQVRREYGMDDLIKKKRVIYKKTKKDKIILAPYEMKMAEKRKFSLVAGRHNYFLNRQMLKYAARIVTTAEGDDSHAQKRITALDEKMRELRKEHRHEVAEQAALANASVPTSQQPLLWKFDRPKKKPIPKSLLDYHKGAFEAKVERHKVRDVHRKEKEAKDAIDEEENYNRRKHDVLNRLLQPKLN